MIKTLVVDDSQVICTLLKRFLEEDGRFSVCDFAYNGAQALEKNIQHSPDLIIMDINMPVMDGIQATKKILENTNPAIVAFSTEDAADIGYRCLEAGALELVRKPELTTFSRETLKFFFDRLFLIADKHAQIKKISSTVITPPPRVETTSLPPAQNVFDAVLIGSSTGGPGAVQKILSSLDENFPLPVFVTQHIDEVFDVQLIKWLSGTLKIPVALAENGDVAKKGHVYFAPASKHLTFKRNHITGEIVLALNDSEPVHFLKPSVDIMFKSAAEVFGGKTLALLLTGMGTDGAEGCKTIALKGGMTLAQSEDTCVVFGMPKAAIACGGAREIVPLDNMASKIKGFVGC